MCAAAADASYQCNKLYLPHYEPYDFNGDVVSLNTAEPHLTQGYQTVDSIISVTQRALLDLSSYLQQQYPELKGLDAEALNAKTKEYEDLKNIFRHYHGFVENSQHYLKNLRQTITEFDRPRVCPTDRNTFNLLDPEFGAQIDTFLADAETKIRDLKTAEKRMAQKISRLLAVQTETNDWLGWFGKAIASGGEVGYVDAAKQRWKPRNHLAGV